MQLELYHKVFESFFQSELIKKQIIESVELVRNSSRIFFFGNGGSNSICSHMMEDYAKMGGMPTFSFSDAPLITCFANDYGYEKAMEEYLKIHFTGNDLLVAISSSGESKNILNAVKHANSVNKNVITLSGFKPGNTLNRSGKINIHTPVDNYGIAECFHQVILHVILDELTKK